MAITFQEGEAGKCCTRCNTWKLLPQFSKRNAGDGYQSHCKQCRSEHERQIRALFPQRSRWSKRKYRLKNSEKISTYRREFYYRNRQSALDYAKEYRKRHLARLANRERLYYITYQPYILDRRRRYYESHAEESRLYARQYWQKNKERVQEYQRRYRKENPGVIAAWRAANRDKLRASKHRRRARIRSAGPSFTAAQWAELKHQYNYTCLCCKRREPEIKLVPDHVIPLGPPGTGRIENIQPLCETCNKRKATKATDYRDAWWKQAHQSASDSE